MKQHLKRDMARKPTLAQRTRKDGAPGIVYFTGTGISMRLRRWWGWRWCTREV
jgi:hypothetical protein